jgi:hypothetical protein
MAVRRIGDGAVSQFWTSRTEQGFRGRQHGTPAVFLEDFEGVLLATRYLKLKKELWPNE